jgi:hypothetical protein
MDRDDGQDIQHYDSVEAIAPMQDAEDLVEGHVPSARNPDEMRDANDITPDEMGSSGSVSDLPLDDDSVVPSSGEVADTYDEESADMDFDPDSDPLGMGLDESDDMISGE